MNLIRFLVSSISRWRLPSTKDQWIKLLVVLSLWDYYLLITACLASILIGALTTNPSTNPIGFIFSTIGLALALGHSIFIQTVDVNYIAVSERWGAKKIGNRVYITLDAFTLLIEGVVLFLTAPSPPWSISYMVTSSSCFSLANIRLVLVNLTAGRCLHAPYDAPPEFAKPRRVFGSLYTLKQERLDIVFVRVFLTVLIIEALFVFASNTIISGPSQGVQSLKTYQPQDSFDWSAWEAEWSISIIFRPLQTDDTDLVSAVNVTISNGLGDPVGGPCFGQNSLPSAVTFDCIGVSPSARQAAVVSVNYANLVNNSEAYVYVGLTNNTKDVYASTSPIQLVPGDNLRGSVVPNVKTTLTNPRLATFGFFTISRSFLFTTIPALLPNPNPPIPPNSSMATLALRIVDNDIPGIQITLADTQVKTVLGGFAGVGGLWTILNGVFAILFGGSFIYNIFGSKPLSVFGLLHYSQRNELRRRNAIPKAVSPLAVILERYFIDFGAKTNESEDAIVVEEPHHTESGNMELGIRDIRLSLDPEVGNHADEFTASMMQNL